MGFGSPDKAVGTKFKWSEVSRHLWPYSALQSGGYTWPLLGSPSSSPCGFTFHWRRILAAIIWNHSVSPTHQVAHSAYGNVHHDRWHSWKRDRSNCVGKGRRFSTDRHTRVFYTRLQSCGCPSVGRLWDDCICLDQGARGSLALLQCSTNLLGQSSLSVEVLLYIDGRSLWILRDLSHLCLHIPTSDHHRPRRSQ